MEVGHLRCSATVMGAVRRALAKGLESRKRRDRVSKETGLETLVRKLPVDGFGVLGLAIPHPVPRRTTPYNSGVTDADAHSRSRPRESLPRGFFRIRVRGSAVKAVEASALR